MPTLHRKPPFASSLDETSMSTPQFCKIRDQWHRSTHSHPASATFPFILPCQVSQFPDSQAFFHFLDFWDFKVCPHAASAMLDGTSFSHAGIIEPEIYCSCSSKWKASWFSLKPVYSSETQNGLFSTYLYPLESFGLNLFRHLIPSFISETFLHPST